MRLWITILLICLCSPAWGQNLIKNSGFELGVDWWGASEGNNRDIPLNLSYLTTTNPHSGTYCMRISQGQTNGGYRATVPYRLKPSTTYTLSLWGRADTAGNNLVLGVTCTRSAAFGGANAVPLTNVAVLSGGSWNRYTTTFTTQSGSNTAYTVHMHGYGTGSDQLSVWVDDLQLEEGPSSTTWAPSADVEIAFQYPDSREANMFYDDEVVTVPFWTHNYSTDPLTPKIFWVVQDYNFNTVTNGIINNTVSALTKVTNNLILTRSTNIYGRYRLFAWITNYDNSITENSFSVIPHRIPLSYPATNSHFGAMLVAKRYWAENSFKLGFNWHKAMGTGSKTNTGKSGQWGRWREVRPDINTFNLGHIAGMQLMTNIGFTTVLYLEWLPGEFDVLHTNDWGLDNTGTFWWTNYNFLYVSNYYNYPSRLANAYKGVIKYWILGNEFDTEGRLDYGQNGGDEAINASGIIVSNAWTAIKSNDPTAIIIPYHAFQPNSWQKMSNWLGPNFFTDKILASDVYPAGEFGAERLYTNIDVPMGMNHHWDTETGTTGRSDRDSYLFEEFFFGTQSAGTQGVGGSDGITRAGELIRNYVMWSKWPTHDLWVWHVIDDKRSVEDPQSHTIFDWDGSASPRCVAVAALAQRFEGSYGRSNLVSNAFPATVLGGKFARGSSNTPIVVFCATNDSTYYRAHVRLATNQFKRYDLFGNVQQSFTNIEFSHLPVILEGANGVNSNDFWTNILINATATDTTPPRVIMTHFPTGTNGANPFFRWAARDNKSTPYPQVLVIGSGKTNHMSYRWMLSPYTNDFTTWQKEGFTAESTGSGTIAVTPTTYRTWYTNLAESNYVFYVQCMDLDGNIGSNSVSFAVGAGGTTPVPPDVPEDAARNTTGFRGIRIR